MVLCFHTDIKSGWTNYSITPQVYTTSKVIILSFVVHSKLPNLDCGLKYIVIPHSLAQVALSPGSPIFSTYQRATLKSWE